jgi:hypothetical protein
MTVREGVQALNSGGIAKDTVMASLGFLSMTVQSRNPPSQADLWTPRWS